MARPDIITIPILPLGMVNAFLLIVPGGAVLIDAGLPGSERKIRRALAGAGLTSADLRLIVVTHGHIDHAGDARALRDLSGAPILMHEADIAYCQGEQPLLRPTGAFGRIFKMTGAIEAPFPHFTPDIVLSGSEERSLTEFGVKGRVLPTSGHTPGSISLLMDDGTVFAGDLAASGILLGGIALRNRPRQPPFEEDPAEVAASLRMLLERGARRFYLGHGGPLGAAAIQRHVARLERPSAMQGSTRLKSAVSEAD
ncbi:MBL fold metallo-hydrolase [Roseibium sp.]|uniref:MBL fold metallo-hydrolase n=1 Tax=Roseibium sp. TaxID=1936156 RepID=UPI003D0C3467